jgi:hypothetical protein
MVIHDVIEWTCPTFGSKRRWKILGIHLGALGQESIVEMESVTHRPGQIPHLSPFPLPILYVPESLLRCLPICVESTNPVCSVETT